MIAWLIGMALAAPVDIERARAAIEQDDPDAAVEHARIAVSEEPANWRAQQVYAEALASAGLTHRIRAELGPIADVDQTVAVVLAWHEARTATSSATAMAAISEAGETEADVASLALGALAVEGGNAAVAQAVLQDNPLPEALSVRLDALRTAGQDAEAIRLARDIQQAYPERPDLLAPLFGRGEASRALRRARARAVRDAHDLGANTEDAATGYRARTLLVAAGEAEPAQDVVDRLVRLGEPRLPPRRSYSPAMRRGIARGLGMQRNPSLPEGPPDEVRDIGISVAVALRDMGRIPEALAVWEALREQGDDSELATAHARQIVRTGRAAEAIGPAQDAVALALQPHARDMDRSDVRAWQHELATAYAVLAEVYLLDEQPDAALEPAVMASLLAPTSEHLRLRAVAFRTLGHEEASWTSLAISDALGGLAQAQLETSYPGVGFWADAARDAAERWSDQTGAELPQRDANALPERPERPIVNAPFPEWRAEQADYGSADLEGDVVVMAFWASWCGPCKRELPALDEMAQEWRGIGVRVVALSVDDQRRDYDRYLSRHPLAHVTPVYAPGVGERLGIGALPTTWVIDREGIARIFHQGFSDDSAERLDEEVRELAR